MLKMKDKIQLFKGDCLEIMDRLIEDGIKVDLILCDPPYGTTACKWDSIIPLDKIWERFDRRSESREIGYRNRTRKRNRAGSNSAVAADKI